MGLLQPMTCPVGDRSGVGDLASPPHLGCLWCSTQCRRSSCRGCVCPCCATTRAHGARDSAGAAHSSSCGAHRGVVHSPFGWLHHRCHYYCRDFVLFVGRLLALRPFVLRGCLRCGIVWWWMFPGGAYDSVLGKWAADDWKFSFISSSSGRWVCCMLNGWFSSNDDICPGFFFFPGSS